MLARIPQRRSIIACVAVILAAGVLAEILWLGGSEEAVRGVIRNTAKLSALLFSAAFSASALRSVHRSSASAWLLRNRRYLGLSFALSHFVHLLALVSLAAWFPSDFLPLDPVTLAGGGLAYVFIAAQAATSSDAAVRRLGAPRWRKLHTIGSYVIWGVFTVTYAPGIPERPGAAPFTGLLLAVIALRALARVRRRAPRSAS